MCTLIVARKVFRKYSTVVAANRDEALARPSSPPRIWDGSPRILAPVDEHAGGTWIGVSERGIVAAITNRHDVPSAADRESRGTLVLAALQANDAATAAQVIASLSGAMFNGFHLVVADPAKAFILGGDGETISCLPLPDGLHVITQFGTGPGHSRRAANVEARYGVYVRGLPPMPVALNQLLCDHVSGSNRGIDGTCVHMPGYGTRSSTLIRVDDPARGADWWHREGPACGRPFERKPLRFDFSL